MRGVDGWQDKRWIKVVVKIGRSGLCMLHVCVFNVHMFMVNSNLRDVRLYLLQCLQPAIRLRRKKPSYSVFVCVCLCVRKPLYM